MKKTGTLLCLLLALALLIGCAGGRASALRRAQAQFADAPAAYGSEWLVIAMAAGAFGPEGWQTQYADTLKAALADGGGALPGNKSTAVSLAVLAATAAGLDARDVGGYDLTAALGDRDAVLGQGLNGAVFALLALDYGEYPVPDAPEGAAQATREGYVAEILSRQLPDGGFAYNGDRGDPDMTAMTLMALASYGDADNAVDAAVSFLSQAQGEDGGYASWGAANCESCAQVILSMCQLGIGREDPRFVKNGHTVEEKLLTYALPDGSFAHEAGGAASPSATMQALLALTALEQYDKNGTGLFTPSHEAACTLEIRCDTILRNPERLPEEKSSLVPEDGVLLKAERVTLQQEETVLTLLERVLRERGIHYEVAGVAAGGTAYVEGIGNLYETDCGALSGWEFSVNGAFPGVGCGQYVLRDGDVVLWQYTCDMGADIGNEYDAA